MDYGYIDYMKKALAMTTDPAARMPMIQFMKMHEAERDYYTPSLRQINHLIQIDEKPNLELKEARCEIYKLSLSFGTKCRVKRGNLS